MRKQQLVCLDGCDEWLHAHHRDHALQVIGEDGETDLYSDFLEAFGE